MSQLLELTRLIDTATDNQVQAWLSSLSPDQRAERLNLVRQAVYAREPFRFARSVFPHHFRLPTSARWHADAIRLLTRAGVEESEGAGSAWISRLHALHTTI